MNRMSLCRPPRGVTLIELLAVIAIIGVLAGLLLMAVQAARESARRTQCQNNLRQLGVAMQNHEATYGFMPACERNLPLDTYPTDPPNPHLAFTGAANSYGPLLHLLPFLEQENIYKLWDLKRAWHDPINLPAPYGTLAPGALASVATFVCPSTPYVKSDYGPFLASAGIGDGAPLVTPRSDYIPTKGVHSVLNECAGNSRDHTYNGLLSTNDPDTKHSVRSTEVTDGMSHTILFVELAGKQGRFFRGRVAPPSGDSFSDYLISMNSFYGDPDLGMLITGYSGANELDTGDEGCLTVNIVNRAAPYSFHSGGAFAVMGDGSVRLLPNSIAPRSLVALLTRDGGESHEP